jgi:hypothetical protein
MVTYEQAWIGRTEGRESMELGSGFLRWKPLFIELFFFWVEVWILTVYLFRHFVPGLDTKMGGLEHEVENEVEFHQQEISVFLQKN